MNTAIVTGITSKTEEIRITSKTVNGIEGIVLTGNHKGNHVCVSNTGVITWCHKA